MQKILIVEDVELNIDLLVQLLEDDYELIVARDGAQGLELIRQQQPDLVLLDMSLPLLDGWEVARQVRSDPALRALPLIGLSAHAMSGDAERALEAGCNDYLTKPLNDAELFNRLAHWLGGA